MGRTLAGFIYGVLVAVLGVVLLAGCASGGGSHTLPPPVTKPSWLTASPSPTETEPTTSPPTSTPSPSGTPTATPSYTWGPTSCGVERWPVKTGSDADASKVNLTPVVPTTISALGNFNAPSVLPQSNRISPQETTVYQISAALVGFKKENDSDYHLILNDGSGHTMIAEIPNPGCVSSKSIALTQIEQVRAAFDARFNVTGSFTQVNVPVTITGIGFFDFLHGQTGVAPNGIELHPVLSIKFGG